MPGIRSIVRRPILTSIGSYSSPRALNWGPYLTIVSQNRWLIRCVCHDFGAKTLLPPPVGTFVGYYIDLCSSGQKRQLSRFPARERHVLQYSTSSGKKGVNVVTKIFSFLVTVPSCGI